MSQKNKKNIANVNKWGTFAFYTLLFLGVEILICLIINWMFGDPDFNNKISDTFVTAFLQNYNYILGTVCLLPVIAYMYSKIKKQLESKYISDSQMMLFGFFGFIFVLACIISVCSLVYPINSYMLYGANSKVSVGIFLVPVVILILESIVYGFLTIPNLIKNKEFWKTVRKNAPMILMVMFLIWTFISCMLAPGAADTVLGEKAPKEEEILAKTLNGCYNLKDGFWAFLMYGSVLLCTMMLGKDRIKEKKILIKVFVVAILVLTLITLSVTAYASKLSTSYKQLYEVYKENPSQYSSNNTEMTEKDFETYAKSIANEVYYKWNVFPQRAIFRNSNHFAYVLSMAIIAAAMLALIEKNIYEKVLYIVSFGVLTYMLIINDTFGGYLGVFVALVVLLIYVIGSIILYFAKRNKLENDEKKCQQKNIISMTAIVLVICVLFGLLSYFTVRINDDGSTTRLAVRNINNFVRDIGIFGGYMINEENATEADINTIDTSITKAGSGRGETWIKIWELVKQRPLFGYGLECLLFQFNGQFGVNEGRTHNLLLQLLGTIGIPGTIMYFAALATIFIRLVKNWKTWNDIEKICVFVGISYIVTALTGNSTYYTSPYFMMFLGLVALTPWKRESEDEQPITTVK